MTLATETMPIAVPAVRTDPSAWQYFRNVVSTTLTVLAVMVASVALVLAVATHFSPRGQYRVFGHPVMIVLSGSMTPVIRTGDLVVDDGVTTARAAHLQVGQIISVRDTPGSQTIITHRIVGVLHTSNGVAYITKGDANQSADAVPRPAADVIGVFSTDIPRGGYVLNALHEPLVLGLLLASPVLWFLSGLFYQWAREMDGPASQDPAGPAGKAGGDR
ncbi:MAG: signal peptidase I [Acidimicrobiales bacterium]